MIGGNEVRVQRRKGLYFVARVCSWRDESQGTTAQLLESLETLGWAHRMSGQEQEKHTLVNEK